ncbi:MAG: 3-deoxy-D-manno-octulosonic acid transferase [Thermodesulfobacteriota bacterium]
MTHLFYNILLTSFLIFASPYFLIRALISGRFRREMIERMGFFPTLSDGKPVWVHAASVGEVFCTIPLLKALKKEFPQRPIALTTMTRTGNERAKMIPEADRVFFLPIDYPLAIRRILRNMNPGLVLLAETELWPNLLMSCGKNGIPVILFNGRVSEKSFRRYLFFRSFFRDCLKGISLFLMQTEEDRKRIVEIGAALDRTRVVGNLKFDQPAPPLAQEALAEMAKSLNLQGKETLLIAGSTHSGEEEILLGLFKDLKKFDPHLVLVLAPRHLDRLEEVERVLKKESILWSRKTSLSSDQGRPAREQNEVPEVILLDTMGELMNLYSLGTLVFIGGTLVPVGGHNPLEPLFFKKPVLFGPHMFHFSEISRHLIQAGGAIQAGGKEELAFHLKRLLSDEGGRKEMGEKGYQFLQRHQGATGRMMGEIRPFLRDIADRRF